MTEAQRVAQIVKSDVFKAINCMIDEKAGEMEMFLSGFKARVDRAFSSQPGVPRSVTVRCSYEDEKSVRQEYALPGAPVLLRTEIDTLQQIIRLEDEIGGLMQFKLRLLNDYDFTHGDKSIQKLVFGGKP
jgi:hypothetical protein